MLQVLAFAALLLVQDPKPAPKTVEDRLQELAERLSALEKKEKALTQENAALDREITDAKVQREKFARQSAVVWTGRYVKPVELTPPQVAELEELWAAWTKEEAEKPGDPGRWKAREDALRSKLTPEQIPRFARKVREEREEHAKGMIVMFSRSANLAADKSAALDAAVLRRLSIGEGTLLPQAHPEEKVGSWGHIVAAVDGCVSDLSLPLSEEERSALSKILTPWKPKQK
ncbi:MAG TPA: hypothetical protein VMU54_26385 [Planctomycetota bacterium]|nr:hypothetical protein [Planctomycetota bacterium]